MNLSSAIKLRALLVTLLLVAFALRLYHLAYSGFWFDEAASHFIASKGLLGIVEYARPAPGEHPPLYYMLLFSWMQWAGSSEFSLRFFSVWFGVLFIALFYRFTRRHFDARLALLATLLSVPLPFLVDYSQEARMYTLVLCPTVLAMDYFLRWARGERHAAYKHFLFLIIALSIHYYAILLIAVQDVYVFGRRELWRSLGRPILFLHLAVLLILAAWFVNASGALVFVNRAFANPLFAGRGLGELSRIAVDLTVGGVLIRNMTDVEYILAASVWLIILIGILWAHRDKQAAHGLPLRGWLFASAIVPPLLAAVVPYVYAARYLFMTIPALLILLACGLMALRSMGRAPLLVGVVALLLTFGMGININYNFVKSPYREMAAQISAEARADDGLILNGPGQWTLALYYLHGPWAQSYIPTNPEAAELVDIDPAMRAMQHAHTRLWVLGEQTTAADPGNNVARWLSLNAYPVSRHWFKTDESVALVLSERPMPPGIQRDNQFGEWLMLEQSAISTHNVAAGDGLAVTLTWHALKPIPQKEQLLVTLRLFDQQGHVVQERVSKPCDGFCPIDDWAPGDAVADHHGLLVPRAALAGEYVLRLEVYAPRQQQSLPIKSAHGDLGASLELARINVHSAPTSVAR